MNKNNIIMILAVGAGGYLAYWYVTKHGPGGAAFNAAGQQIAPSWWDTWFGNAPVTGTTTGPAQTGAGGTVAGQPVQSPAQALPPVQAPAPVASHFSDPALWALRNSMFSASGNQTSLNADNWSYFMTQVTGAALTPEQFVAAFPSMTDTDRGGNMTVDQFLTAIYKSQHGNTAPGMSGMGMIVRSPNMQPSMAFSNARRGAFAGKGGYIQ
jgi:hypothetical protein